MRMPLIEYETRFLEILKWPPSVERDAYLLLLMEDIEEAFGIKVDDNSIEKDENIKVRTLYKLIRRSRTE